MTTTSSVSGVTGGTGVLSTANANFGDNQFLQLLTAQLQNQTPLSPVDDQSFMNQMATYSSMSEQKQLNGNMLKLLDYQGVLARMQGLGQGSALLGKQVEYLDDAGQTQKGTVDSVYVDQGGDVRLKLTGGADVAMRKVTGISQKAS